MEQITIEEMKIRINEFRSQDIMDIDPESLTDLADLKIDPKLPVMDRVLSLLEQSCNPYAYRDRGMVVKISFSESGRSLQECMEEYLVSELMPDLE